MTLTILLTMVVSMTAALRKSPRRFSLRKAVMATDMSAVATTALTKRVWQNLRSFSVEKLQNKSQRSAFFVSGIVMFI